jgi:transmembrane sensor
MDMEHDPRELAAEPDDACIERYIADTCSDEDRLLVEAWIRGYPDAGSVVLALRSHASRSVERVTGIDTASAQQRIWKRVRDEGRLGNGAVVPSRQRSRSVVRWHSWDAGHLRSPAPWLGAPWWGALCAIVMAAGALIWRNEDRVARSAKQYQTSAGQRLRVELADGSVVTLAPHSRLAVGEGFGTVHRNAVLTGEAHFTVTTFTHAPFVVRTGSVQTRVLGTSFTVRRYADERVTRVAVVSGKVLSIADHTDRGMTLTAGSAATIGDSTAVVLTRTDAQSYTEWTKGQLVFKETPAPEMLAAIGRWYGIRFRLADSALASQRVTTTLMVDNRTETMHALKYLLDVTMTFDGTTIVLHPQRNSTRQAAPARRRVIDSSTIFNKEFGK